MSEEKSRKPLRLLRFAPMVLIVVLATLIVVIKGPAALTGYVELYKDNLFVTTLLFFGLFLFKSVSFGLPYTVLYIAIGHIYPLPIALLINVVGIAINMQIPYFVGRYGSFDAIDTLLEKAAFVRNFKEQSDSSEVVFAFLVKFIGVVPHEITNLLLGTLEIGYISFMIGGIGGLLPGMIATTIAGDSLRNPFSLQFVGSIAAVVGLLLFSFYLSRRIKDRQSR
ncbi:MAG TPA: VTT domain-containing protein [Sphaerochaeta sp.]|nr:VTT domain-containing protein [Sphaerochaeta sp.]